MCGAHSCCAEQAGSIGKLAQTFAAIGHGVFQVSRDFHGERWTHLGGARGECGGH